MTRFCACILLVCGLALHAAGQGSPSAHEMKTPAQMVEGCLTDAEQNDRDPGLCIGVSVRDCAENVLSTVDTIACIQPEFSVWNSRMDEAYQALSNVYAEQDAEDDPIRALAPRLDMLQRQWISWRDAKCGFEYDKYRGGSMGRVTSADCHLHETALRVLELATMLEEASY